MKPTLSHAACIAGIVLFGVAVLSGRTAVASTASDAQTIKDLDQRWATAEVTHDKAFLERFLDDRFVVTDDAGKTENKAQSIADTLSDTSMKSQSITQNALHLYGDAAVAVVTDTAGFVKHGTLHYAKGKFTITLIKRDGQWYAAAEQWVFIPSP